MTTESDFEALVRHVTTSYAGFPDKVKGRAGDLETLTKAIRTRLLKSPSLEECPAILKEWLSFFRDRHMSLGARETPLSQMRLDPETLRADLLLTHLDSETVVLRIPTFAPSLSDPLNQILREHRDQLLSHKFMILDLRGNGGGADYVYSELIPFLYAQPMVLVGVDFWASKENTEYYRNVLNHGSLPPEIQCALRPILDRMEASPDTLVFGVPDQTIALDEVLPLPNRIGIVIDNGCASATEQFLLLARQSRKVTLYGIKTAGCLDYSNLRDIELPSGRFVLRLPISRSRRLPDRPVDPNGIEPDVRVSEADGDPVIYARRHMAREEATEVQ